MTLPSKRLTWQEIKEQFPHLYVGLTDIEYKTDGVSVDTAIVAYTSVETSYDDLSWDYLQGKILMRYTTLDEDELQKGDVHEDN